MKKIRPCHLFLLLVSMIIILTAGCASKKVNVKDDIRADTGVTNIEIDELADKIIEQVIAELSELKNKTIAIKSIDNMTAEHFNTSMISDQIKAALRKKLGAVIVERDKMQVLKDEHKLIDETASHIQERNKFWGADYLLYGRIDSIDKTKSAGWNPITKKQETYFKLTVSITNTSTSVEVWSGQADFKKTQVKTKW